MYNQGQLKQQLRCKSGVEGFLELQRFLHANGIDFVRITNSSEIFNHKVTLHDIDILFTFDGFRIDELIAILEARYLK